MLGKFICEPWVYNCVPCLVILCFSGFDFELSSHDQCLHTGCFLNVTIYSYNICIPLCGNFQRFYTRKIT
ncbi:hypothetical protein L9F63_017378, partial [Diploptera punctata]